MDIQCLGIQDIIDCAIVTKDGRKIVFRVRSVEEPDTGDMARHKKEDGIVKRWVRCWKCGNWWWAKVKGSGGRPTTLCLACRQANRAEYRLEHVRNQRIREKKKVKIEARRDSLSKKIDCPSYLKCLDKAAKMNRNLPCARCTGSPPQ